MLSTSHARSGYHSDSFTITPVGMMTTAANNAHAHHRSA